MNIFILGGGVFGTAIGNQLSNNPMNKVVLLIRNNAQEIEINEHNTNKRYFPNKKLNKSLSATTEKEELLKAEVIFIVIPSKKIVKALNKFAKTNKRNTEPPKKINKCIRYKKC